MDRLFTILTLTLDSDGEGFDDMVTKEFEFFVMKIKEQTYNKKMEKYFHITSMLFHVFIIHKSYYLNICIRVGPLMVSIVLYLVEVVESI